MPKFRKLVVTPGVHNVGRLDGRTEAVAITPERIAGWVRETNRLKELGVKVPAPFAHQDHERKFPFPVVLGSDGCTLADAYTGDSISWDAQLNGGFWDSPFELDPATGGLVGEVESPGSAEDPNTPAGKIGTTVRETSVLVMGPRTVRDSQGKEHQIGEHLAHVALCLHPAQPGQRNFEPVPAPLPADMKMAMSFAMSDLIASPPKQPGAASGAIQNNLQDPLAQVDQELNDTIALLANVVYISMPADTSRENFVSYLNVCLRQKSADQQEQEAENQALTTPPPDGTTKQPSIAMSQQPTKTPPAAPNSSDTLLVMFMSNLVNDYKAKLKARLAKCKERGQLRKPELETRILGLIDAFAMSSEQFTESKGTISRSSAEDMIEVLEQTAPLTGESLYDSGAEWNTPPGTQVEPRPDEGVGVDLTPEQSNEIIDFAIPHLL